MGLAIPPNTGHRSNDAVDRQSGQTKKGPASSRREALEEQILRDQKKEETSHKHTYPTSTTTT
ncbi:hypothetical protein NEUTE1DRAFT_95082, partial [Neurospora tetrasperma FGSC 2508]